MLASQVSLLAKASLVCLEASAASYCGYMSMEQDEAEAEESEKTATITILKLDCSSSYLLSS